MIGCRCYCQPSLILTRSPPKPLGPLVLIGSADSHPVPAIPYANHTATNVFPYAGHPIGPLHSRRHYGSVRQRTIRSSHRRPIAGANWPVRLLRRRADHLLTRRQPSLCCLRTSDRRYVAKVERARAEPIELRNQAPIRLSLGRVSGLRQLRSATHPTALARLQT